MLNINRNRKLRRKRRISSNIFGTAQKPRISVYRSNKYIYAQAIDDAKKITLASYSSLILNKKEKKPLKKTEKAKAVGQELANFLKAKKIEQAVFDRGMYAYAGRVKSIAEGLRVGGIRI